MAGVGEIVGALGNPSVPVETTAAAVDAGLSAWVDLEGDEIALRARYAPAGGVLGLYLGLRKFAGRERWKTFLDADLNATVLPALLVGLRVALGVEWDPVRLFGAFASVGLGGEAGAFVRVRLEALVGIQLRLDIAGP